jgi:sugar lactone lactonase YvrE
MKNIFQNLVLFCCLISLSARGQFITTITGKLNAAGTRDSCATWGEGYPATDAYLNSASFAMCRDKWGNIYVGDIKTVKKIDAVTGIITTIAGNYASTYLDISDTIPATNALIIPKSLCADTSGHLYISDNGNNRVLKLNLGTGYFTTYAGTASTSGYAGDGGPATAARLFNIQQIALDKFDNLYIADYQNNRIRRVDAATGIITTVAGSGPVWASFGYTGDGGPATSSKLSAPWGVCVDPEGNIIIADRGNSAIRKIEAATGIITTIAGTGTAATTGGLTGPATAIALDRPVRVTSDDLGNIYISSGDADATTPSGGRIMKLDKVSGMIMRFAGRGTPLSAPMSPYLHDSISTDSAFISPGEMAFDTCGNLFYADLRCRLRKIWTIVPCKSFDTGSGGGGGTDTTVYTPTAAKAGVEVFPNPTTGRVFIQGVPEQTVFRITGITGMELKQVQPRSAGKGVMIGIDELPAGSYLLDMLLPDGERIVKRIVKTE